MTPPPSEPGVVPFVRTLAEWLRCPACGEPLEPVERLTLGCASGHRFDANKRGYVTLLPGGSGLIGDSAGMLEARTTVLEGGAFAPIVDAVAALAVGARILDAGAGTGHYLRAALGAAPNSQGLAMDLSPTAVALSARSSDRIEGLVADTWRSLPVRSNIADCVLDVFAPRNLLEFHRVLKPRGRLVVVVPRASHLAELRAGGAMLDVPADKAEDLIESAAALYALQSRVPVEYELELAPALRDALAGMGPSARHGRSGTTDAAAVTVSVDVLAFAAR